MTMLAELEHPKIPTNPGFTSILPAILGVKKLLKPLSGDVILNLPLCSDCRIQHAMRICKKCVVMYSRLDWFDTFRLTSILNPQ
jgi:hypothetical protein